jgi:diguanylate cyclase (GGDEF) domain
MQEFEETYEKWRNMLFYTTLCIGIFVFAIEVLMYFILHRANSIMQPLPEYLFKYLMLPTALDGAVIFLGYIALKKSDRNMKYINYIPVIQMSIICMVVAYTHNYFSITQCVFCIPIFATTIFNNRAMTKNITMVNCLFLLIIFLSKKYSAINYSLDIYVYSETVISFSFIITVYLVCNVLIKYQEEKNDILQKSYMHQLEMQEMLNKDQKTGLYGYTMLFNTLQKMTSDNEECIKEFALAIIDVDDFKNINDTYGHAMGDQIIIMLAELMKKYCSDNHLPARFGGEEFAIILNEGEKSYYYDFIERLRKDFAKISSGIINDTVTISCGIAKWTPSLTAEELFNNADSAMYLSKTTGKNRTTILNI